MNRSVNNDVSGVDLIDRPSDLTFQARKPPLPSHTGYTRLHSTRNRVPKQFHQCTLAADVGLTVGTADRSPSARVLIASLLPRAEAAHCKLSYGR